MDLVTNSLEYYDKNREKYQRLVEKIRYYKVDFRQQDMEHPIVYLYNSKKEKILESRFEIIGTYFNGTQTWVWSWANPQYPKNVSYLSRKIVQYGWDMEIKSENTFLRTELLTSRTRIADPLQLDIHVAVSAYLLKQPFVIPIVHTAEARVDVVSEYGPKTEKNEQYEVYYYVLLDLPKM